MPRRKLTAKRLGEMTADEAAAYFIIHHEFDLTEAERGLFTSWVRSDQSHARAMDRAVAVWHCFDDTAGDEILAKMRAHPRKVTARR